MSTKIYYGLRFKLEDINRGIDFISTKMWNQVVKSIKDVGIVDHTDPHCIHKFNDFMQFVGSDYTSGFNLWVHSDGYCYVALIAEHGTCEAVLRRLPSFIEEFGYYDSVDKPKRVSQKQWDARRDVWEAICLEGDRLKKTNHNARRLYYSAFDWQCREYRFYLLTDLGLYGKVYIES